MKKRKLSFMGSLLILLMAMLLCHPAFSLAESVYTITATAGEGGTITPEGDISVSEGGTQGFTIIPNMRFEAYALYIDGVAKMADEYRGDSYYYYEFKDISADHTIHAVFLHVDDPITYNITSSCGEHGNISPFGNITLLRYANQTFAIIPDDGYVVSTLYVDSEVVEPAEDNTYTFEHITADHIIHVSFKPGLIASTVPKSDDFEVSVNTPISVTFSKEMDASTINADTFLLKTGSVYNYTTVPGTVTYEDKTATFTPSAPLDYLTGYRALMTTGIKDLSGKALEYDYEVVFVTENAVSPVPGPSDTNVDISTLIKVTFLESIDPSTLNQDTFFVSTGSDYSLKTVASEITYKDKTATFTPALPLDYATTYTVTLTTGIKKSNGDPLLKYDYHWSFDTEYAPLSIISTSPVDSATNVAINSGVSVTFANEPDYNILKEIFHVKKSPSDAEIDGGIFLKGTTATFVPLSPLEYETSYTAVISIGAEDYTWQFTTAEKTATTGSSVMITQGTSVQSVNNDTEYSLPISVVVTDENGNPVPNATVSLIVFPVSYATGYWDENGNINAREAYPNEDLNRNLILDSGEDINGDGALTPPYSAVGTLSGPGITDENGIAEKELTYPKTSAAWIEAEITAVVTDSGTSYQGKSEFWLPYLESEATSLPHSPPYSSSDNPPTVIEKSATNKKISIAFSSAMDSDTLNSDTVIVKAEIPGIGYGIVAGKIEVQVETITFTPYSDLQAGLTYTVIITKAAKDLNGNPLEEDYESESFVFPADDKDGDGYTTEQGDCDDTNPAIYPNATEICGDGIDQDCSGSDLSCTTLTAQIIDRGLIDGFEEGLLADDGSLVYCETSAIVYDGENIILASDKPIPGEGHSSVFSIPYQYNFLYGLTTTPVTYMAATPFADAIKYEDMTLTPDGKYIIATTGFDRVQSDSAEWNNYNTLLMWQVGSPENVQVVSGSTTDGITSSVSLREKISSALKTEQFPEGVPYFKIEGLTAIPGNQLLFGIRELGERYDNFEYAIKIVAVSYEIKDNTLILGDDYTLIYDYSPANLATQGHTVALSSIEYDPYRGSLYILTSYEEAINGVVTDEGIGGYLWSLPLAYLGTGNAPIPIQKEDTTPLLFAHKPEGITVISKTRVLVIHDDDRVIGRDVVENPETQFSRKAHQAAYTIIDLIEGDLKSRNQSKLDEIVSDFGAPGGVLYINDPDGGEFYLASGVSDQETMTLMKSDDRFRIASITKTFTAATVLLLAEDGLLGLDDTIDQYVAVLDIPQDDIITIRQLLNHTSGLPDYLDSDEVINTMLTEHTHQFTPAELIEIALSINPALLFDPGTDFYYSNTGYILLGLIIEAVTGLDFENVVQTRILDPLELTNTFLPEDETIPGSYAHGYMYYAGYLIDITDIHPSLAWSAGAMISTAGDLGRWAQALYGGEVLSESSLDAMLTFVDDSESPDMQYGLGVMHDIKNGVIGHSGSVLGYTSLMLYNPENGEVNVFLANVSENETSGAFRLSRLSH